MTVYGTDSKRIRVTRDLLAWYRAFIRSDADAAHIPGELFGETMTQEEAQTRLSHMIDVAINRKGGIPDSYGRRDTSDHRRALLQDSIDARAARQRVRIYQFRTPEFRRTCGYLLSEAS